MKKIVVWMLCLITIVTCVKKKVVRSASIDYKRAEFKMDFDSARIMEISDSMDRSKELKPFLVDLDAYRKQDTLSPNLCDWYCLKTVNYIDTNLNCEVRIDLPNTSSWQINAVIKKELFAQRDHFLADLNEMNKINEPFIGNGVSNDFSALLLAANQDDEFISFCFSVFYYSAGAPHGMPMFYSFNFDKRTKRRITFNDYFHVETSEDSLLLLDLIRSYYGATGLHLSNVYEFDFNLQQDFVTLNFDAYEITGYAGGTPRVPLNREMIERRFGKK